MLDFPLFCHLAFYLPFIFFLILRYYNHSHTVQMETGLVFLQSPQVNFEIKGTWLPLSDIYLDLKLCIIHCISQS